MKRYQIWILTISLTVLTATAADAVIIDEVLDPDGSGFDGEFLVTPEAGEEVWAFGVGNDNIQDQSTSCCTFINGVRTRDTWIFSLISRSEWQSGFDFDSIRPIGATPPSSFSIDTSTTPWEWGSFDMVAFYWLSEAGDDPANPEGVLLPGQQYGGYNFFASQAASPFAAFTEADGGVVLAGETIVTIVPEPATASLLGVALLALAARRSRGARSR